MSFFLTIDSDFVVSDTIVVRVGTQAKKYTLHERLLVYHSSYFKGALSGRFRETDDGVVPLDDVDTDVFDAFVDWMYEKKLPAYVYTQKDDSATIPVLWHAYILADRLLAAPFKIALFEGIFDLLVLQTKYPLFQTIAFIWEKLTTNDPLLQLLIDTFCLNGGLTYGTDCDPSRFIPEVPQEALARIILKMYDIRGLSQEEKQLKRNTYNILSTLEFNNGIKGKQQ